MTLVISSVSQWRIQWLDQSLKSTIMPRSSPIEILYQHLLCFAAVAYQIIGGIAMLAELQET
jgi:hypothetical protein